MNSIWNKNFQSFNERFPQFVQLLKNQFPQLIKKYSQDNAIISFWELQTSKNNQLTATENGIRLHSLYNPQKEAFNAVNNPEILQKSTTVFYGFGLGYHLIEWSRLYKTQKERKLVIIEPDVEHFFASLSLLDFSDVFEVQNLVFAVGCKSEDVMTLLENGQKINVGNEGVCNAYFFDIPSFTAHAKEYFDEVKQLVKRNQRKNEINAATLKKFGKLWCNNSIKNINQYAKRQGIDILKNKADETLPFLIVGAGPSVEDIIPHLEEIKKRCIIVCVETVLWVFIKAKVEPDFVILTDPQFWAYKHISSLKAKNTLLITEVSVYPHVFNFECKDILLFSSQFPVGKYFEEKCLQKNPGDLGTGGSVASCAWNFAEFCGAKEIFTIGLDFSFPQKQTHIKGSSQEQTFHAVSDKINSAEKQTSRVLFSADVCYEESFDGSKVLTDTRMKMFAWWFEARIANCPHTKTYSLSKKGMKIPGIEVYDLEKFLKTEEKTQKRQEYLSKLQNIPQTTPRQTQQDAPQHNTPQQTTTQHNSHNVLHPIAQTTLLQKIKEMMQNFPTQDFLEQYPYLKPYLTFAK